MAAQFCCERAGDVSGMQVLLGEEVANSKMTLFDVTMQICDAIQARGEQGEYSSKKRDYFSGVVLL